MPLTMRTTKEHETLGQVLLTSGRVSSKEESKDDSGTRNLATPISEIFNEIKQAKTLQGMTFGDPPRTSYNRNATSK